MDPHIFFKNASVIKLPPGFRFHPTDEELVLQYLKRKSLSFPLPAAIIPDLNFCNFTPWDIPGDSGEERYFFSRKESRYPSGSRLNRATCEGCWRSTGSDKHVVSSGGKLVGFKKTLVFYRGRRTIRSSRTDWVMHEYRLVECGEEEWVLCRVFLKKWKKKKNGRMAGPVVYDSSKNVNECCCFSCSCSGSCSTCSSVVTEVDGVEEAEESSGCSRWSIGSRSSTLSTCSSSSSSGFRRK